MFFTYLVLMSYARHFIQPHCFSEFQNRFMNAKVPFSRPLQSDLHSHISPWPFMKNLLLNHDNCWLPLQGRLPDDQVLNTGTVNIETAQKYFQEGRTILCKQAQLSNDLLQAIAKDFEIFFNGKVDLQVYFTPTGNEGFDWHYDAEEVFIIQIAGYKEFQLKKNTINPHPDYSNMPIDLLFNTETSNEKLKCLLAPGDVLYIPAGYWHKAYSLRNSLHFSIGVLQSNSYRNPNKIEAVFRTPLITTEVSCPAEKFSAIAGEINA